MIEPKPRPGSPGWVRARTLAPPDLPVLGWARHDRLVLATDLRRVVGCWPLASLNWHRPEAGDSPAADFRLLFTEKGEVRELGIGDKPISTNYAVYYDLGIFRIWDLSDDDGDLDITGKLLPGARAVELRLELGRLLEPAYTMADRAKLPAASRSRSSTPSRRR
ncbi:MAG TPA: hypothetical protein VKE95_07100 [Burkholderiales bacterium]|nr:hypothetical protein [Burkholderiales bacterium]